MPLLRRKDKSGAEHFGAYVRRLRESRGMTVRDLARATNIHPATWSRGERGILDLRKWDYLAALSKAFGTTPADLFRKAAEEFIVEDITLSIERDYRKARGKGASKRLTPPASELVDATHRILRTGDERTIAEAAAFAKGLLAGSSEGHKRRKSLPIRRT